MKAEAAAAPVAVPGGGGTAPAAAACGAAVPSSLAARGVLSVSTVAFFSATPATMHLKMMLLGAAKKGYAAAIGDCIGAFYRAPLDPSGEDAPD